MRRINSSPFVRLEQYSHILWHEHLFGKLHKLCSVIPPNTRRPAPSFVRAGGEVLLLVRQKRRRGERVVESRLRWEGADTLIAIELFTLPIIATINGASL